MMRAASKERTLVRDTAAVMMISPPIFVYIGSIFLKRGTSSKGILAYFLAFFNIAKNIDEFNCAFKFTPSKMTKQVKFSKKSVAVVQFG
ncbi:hypothetical protein T01_4048 [Trichinella spiralis]|uniref:Uncharacterized protein n=1 Tax=Trichinella spiralis TaxID=6334 RepID=A0A0V1AWT0_TRISP|nr:hypothetical protein T01_4048 [Trichinella spiralis]